MRFARVFLFVALAATVAAVSLATAWLTRPLALTGETAEVSVEPGRSPREIAEAWVRAGVQTSPLLLYEWFRWSGRARQIRAGSYEIGAGTTPIRLLDKMVRGDEALSTVRLNEGWTFRQIRAELARADGNTLVMHVDDSDDRTTADSTRGLNRGGHQRVGLADFAAFGSAPELVAPDPRAVTEQHGVIVDADRIVGLGHRQTRSSFSGEPVAEPLVQSRLRFRRAR